MKLYALLEPIDLGDRLHGIYSSKELAQKELERFNHIQFVRYSRAIPDYVRNDTKLFIEEYELDNSIEEYDENKVIP